MITFSILLLINKIFINMTGMSLIIEKLDNSQLINRCNKNVVEYSTVHTVCVKCV